jgi:hypothetical protein
METFTSIFLVKLFQYLKFRNNIDVQNQEMVGELLYPHARALNMEKHLWTFMRKCERQNRKCLHNVITKKVHMWAGSRKELEKMEILVIG